MADYLISAFGLPTEGESWISIFDVVDKPNFARLAVGEEIDEGQPRAFLNYILYDKNLNFEGMDLDQVSEAAKIPDTDPHLHSHEKLFLDVTIEEEGFIYIYVSNDDKQDMDVYFDDLRVTHHLSDIVAGADYYPFGLKMDGREITREDFRFGYQGQFAEEDEETGWNSFELRMYDPVVGRWMSTDPYGVGFSPYIGMSNNPANKIDPDGGCPKGDCLEVDIVNNSDGPTYVHSEGPEITASGMSFMERQRYDRAQMGLTYNWLYRSFNNHYYETQWMRDFNTFAGAGANAISATLLAPVAGVMAGQTLSASASLYSSVAAAPAVSTFVGNINYISTLTYVRANATLVSTAGGVSAALSTRLLVVLKSPRVRAKINHNLLRNAEKGIQNLSLLPSRKSTPFIPLDIRGPASALINLFKSTPE